MESCEEGRRGGVDCERNVTALSVKLRFRKGGWLVSQKPGLIILINVFTISKFILFIIYCLGEVWRGIRAHRTPQHPLAAPLQFKLKTTLKGNGRKVCQKKRNKNQGLI